MGRSRRGRWGLLAALLAILAGCAPLTPSAPAYPLALLPAECPLRVPGELDEGQTIRCGRLRLSQDRAAPDGLQVELPFALVRAESAHPQPDPLVYVVGGPGGSALAEFGAVYGWFRGLRRDRDLIVYDQRGTLLSHPVLDCSASSSTTETAQDRVRAAAHVPAAYGPVDANDRAILRCADTLQAAGIDLAHYDTPTHAQDLLDLVHALGYTEFNLYATSYGTRLALEVMRLAPSGLRAVVLDSVLPPQVNAYEWQTARGHEEVLRHALALCAADSTCAAAYPDLPARFDALIARLDQTPLTLPVAWQPSMAGSDLRHLLYHRLDAATLPYLPRLVAELETGATGTLLGLLAGSLPVPAAPLASTPDVPGEAVDEVADEAAVSEFVLRLNGAYYLHRKRLDAAAHAEWQRLAARNPDRARLQRFVADYLPAAEAQPLLARLAALTDADLALVFAELSGAPTHPLATGANLAVECRDEVPFNDRSAALNVHRTLGLPDALLADEIAQLRHRWIQCALFPTGVAAITQTLPVSSAVPTLIFQGGLDATTPPSWSAAAQRSLAQAIRLEFPSAGHEVIRQWGRAASSCPARLARDFLDDPLRAPDAACIAQDAYPEWAVGSGQ
jgi:pimeloyl-ACP methyl ester carboxylesterase